MINFNLIDNFRNSSQERIELFWFVVQGGAAGGKNELALILLSILPMMPLLMGFSFLFIRIKFHHMHFMGMERFSQNLPSTFSLLLNVSLWISYFLLSIALLISCYKLLCQKSDLLAQRNGAKLAMSFSPAETVIFSSLRVSEELEKYSKSKMPSDFGLGGDLDWIEGCFYKILSGNRPTGSYSGSTIQTNSFFYNLKTEKEISERLNLDSWYPKSQRRDDLIIDKLFKLRDKISNCYLWHDFSLGAKVYKSLAQTFLAAHLKQKKLFKQNLENTLSLYEEYSKTKNPLKGIPHYTVKFTPKLVWTIAASVALILISVFLYLLLPPWIVDIAKSQNINLEVNSVRNIVLVFLSLLPFLLPWLKQIWK